MNTIETSAGEVIMTHPNLVKIEGGRVGLGILLGQRPKQIRHAVWCLFWEKGGDWNVFPGLDRHSPEYLERWMPEVIREAATLAIKNNLDTEEDMEWFFEWANDAEITLDMEGGEEQ